MTRLICNLTLVLLLIGLFCPSCSRKGNSDEDKQVTTLGSIEITARLVELPEKEFPSNDLYDYVYVLKYQVEKVHRGNEDAGTIYVGHYNPRKPRATVSDSRVKGIGGNLRVFRAGQVHRMALEVPIDDYFMGGIINKYFGENTGPIYWAVWTNLVVK